MPNLYLHVGAGKCASTSIQSFIFSNADRLAAHGILVSDENLTFGRKGNNPLYLIQSLIDQGLSGETVVKAVEKLGNRDGVIAAENLSYPAAAKLFTEVSERFDIHVFHAIRRQDDWLYASWKQWYSKLGKSLDEYVDVAMARGDPGFSRTIEAWKPLAKSIKTVSIDTSASLEKDLLDWLGLAGDSDFNNVPRELNASIDHRIIDILSRHKGAHDDIHDLKIEKFVSSYSTLAMAGKFQLPAATSSRIMAHFHDENVALLGEEATRRFAEDARSTRRAVDGFSKSDEHDFVIACLLEASGRMFADMTKMKIQLDALYKRVSRFGRLPEVTG